MCSRFVFRLSFSISLSLSKQLQLWRCVFVLNDAYLSTATSSAPTAPAPLYTLLLPLPCPSCRFYKCVKNSNGKVLTNCRDVDPRMGCGSASAIGIGHFSRLSVALRLIENCCSSVALGVARCTLPVAQLQVLCPHLI